MKILICSDGTATAENAIRLGETLAAPLKAEVTLLGIAEKSGDESPLREVLEKETNLLRDRGIAVALVGTIRRAGPPNCRSNCENECRSRDHRRPMGRRGRTTTGVR